MTNTKPTREQVMATLMEGGHSEESAGFVVAIQFGDSDGDVLILDEEGNPVKDTPTYLWEHLPADGSTPNPPKRD